MAALAGKRRGRGGCSKAGFKKGTHRLKKGWRFAKGRKGCTIKAKK